MKVILRVGDFTKKKREGLNIMGHKTQEAQQKYLELKENMAEIVVIRQ